MSSFVFIQIVTVDIFIYSCGLVPFIMYLNQPMLWVVLIHVLPAELILVPHANTIILVQVYNFHLSFFPSPFLNT